MAFSFRSNAAQRQKNSEVVKYELTDDMVLTLFGLKKPEYIAVKAPDTNAAKRETTKQGTQMYEWIIKERGKDGKYHPIPKERYAVKWGGRKVINGCATSGDNGIIILKPMTIAQAFGTNAVNKGAVTSTAPMTTNASWTDLTGDTSLGADSFTTMAPSWYEPVGFAGDDEKLITLMMYSKKSLLKECYESLGILL